MTHFLLRAIVASCLALSCGCHAFSSLEIYAGDDARVFVEGGSGLYELPHHEEPVHGDKAPASLAVDEGRPVRPARLYVRVGGLEVEFEFLEDEDAYYCTATHARFPVQSIEHFHNGMVGVWYDFVDLSGALP